MLFTTLHWLVFLLTIFAAYHLAPPSIRRWLMLGASVYFYATWSTKYLLLIATQILVDWSCGQLLGRTDTPHRRRLILAASIVCNLGALCVFKYARFLTRSLNLLGLDLPEPDLTLPLAISFYTFESMSYTIDVYRRQLEPLRSPLQLALFITWFPHLIAGPIIRPSELVPQLRAPRPLDAERFFGGLGLLCLGYTKKLLGADWLGRIADPVFADPGACTTLDLLVGVYAYAFQIYFDFSAYTDIARGASRWFGIDLPENFDAPYLATSITDFWRRWHMTLSHWLRDYLYVPLGGNRRGPARTYANLMLTMLLGGLWHGASWTFVAWGGLHGGYLAIERALGIRPDTSHRKWSRRARQLLTFHLVCVAWILFRAPSFALAADYFRGLARLTLYLSPSRLQATLGAFGVIIVYWLMCPLGSRLRTYLPRPLWPSQLAYAAAAGVLLVALMLFGASSHVFIYFQF